MEPYISQLENLASRVKISNGKVELQTEQTPNQKKAETDLKNLQLIVEVQKQYQQKSNKLHLERTEKSNKTANLALAKILILSTDLFKANKDQINDSVWKAINEYD